MGCKNQSEYMEFFGGGEGMGEIMSSEIGL